MGRGQGRLCIVCAESYAHFPWQHGICTGCSDRKEALGAYYLEPRRAVVVDAPDIDVADPSSEWVGNLRAFLFGFGIGTGFGLLLLFWWGVL